MRGHGGPPPESLDSDENFKPKHALFCLELRFVALFGDLLAKNEEVNTCVAMKAPFRINSTVHI